MDLPTEAWAAAVAREVRRLRPGPEGELLVGQALTGLLGRLPPGYNEQTAPADAAWDVVALLDPGAGEACDGAPLATSASLGQMTLLPARHEGDGAFRLRRAGRRRAELSSFLPVLESFGLVALEAVPWHFSLVGGFDGFVDDIALRLGLPGSGRSGPADGAISAPPERLVEAIGAVVAGEAEISPLNALVVNAGLSWREVNLLCAYCRYRSQAGGPRAAAKSAAIVEALTRFPEVAKAVVRLFKARLAPGPGGPAPAGEEEARAALGAALNEVPDLEHDAALGELVAMVEASRRSSWLLGGSTVAVKFSSADLPFLPAPRPFAEVYVWSTWFEGLHLRFGPVARGGIRFSDREVDLRGEVLGLARAQVKKNSLIVPTGAKGAFCLRPAGSSREPKEAYAAFISALLDITDNVTPAGVTRPPVVCLDGEDPYLVVAADKGTAHFSDLANSISAEKGFWLGDAFASGGSSGYDHKALGITAKGAWLAVRRHFRALGMDADNDALRVAGVGDMSGDVFGNGMLQSQNLRLLAAFDHRHVFVDPNPKPAQSYQERLRLSRLPASSWADYDLSATSEGAAVYLRRAKQAELSPQAGGALGLNEAVTSPPHLVKAVLSAPVDLLFFGGIGTFARGPGENDVEIEDSANDEVRLDAGRLRARVIAEGANLGLTQRARVAYARRGGRVNADFVDNAAGVALSDREVNMKILAGLAESAGSLSPEGRDQLMVQAQEAAARSVLEMVDAGVVALDRATGASPGEMPAYVALLADLEAGALLDRDVEALPSSEELERRREAGAGFSRPELAVLVAYARSELARAVERSPLSAGPELSELVDGYFPSPVREELAPFIPQHPLYRQLAASAVANEILTLMGPVWAHEAAAEIGQPLERVAACYWAARQVLMVRPLAGELAREAQAWPLEAEEAVRDGVSAALASLARWYLLQPTSLVPLVAIAADHDVGAVLSTPSSAPGAVLGVGQSSIGSSLASKGVPSYVVAEVMRLAAASEAGLLGAIARLSDRPLPEVLRAWAVLRPQLGLGGLSAALARAARCHDHWDRRQAHLLADDLSRAIVAAGLGALAELPGDDGATSAGAWLARRGAALSLFQRLLADVDRAVPPSLSLLAVTVRQLAALPGLPGQELERATY